MTDIKATMQECNDISQAVAQFQLYAGLAGVQGYPVQAWYELYHGQGSWTPPNAFDD